MALYLVTGQPGHGKTAYALDLAFKAKKEGRTVYAHGVKDLDYDKAGFIYLDDPTKWQELPDGSFILLDECYTVLPNRNPGAKVPEHIEAIARHRHRGFDFVLVAQQGLQLDPFLRGLYEEHVHVRQTSILKSKTKLKRWNQYQNNTQVACNDVVDWVRPKYVFDYYTSTTMVTTKRSVPTWLRNLVIGLGALVLLLWVIKYYYSNKVAAYESEMSPSASADPVSAARGTKAAGAGGAERRTYNTPSEYAIAHAPRFGTMPWTAPVYDGGEPVGQPELYCMSSQPAEGDSGESSCSCMTEQGTRYELSLPECRRVARHGTPYNPYKQPPAFPAAAPGPMPAQAPAPPPVAVALPGQVTEVGVVSNVVPAPAAHF